MEIVWSHSSDEESGLSHGNILKDMPGSIEKDVHLGHCWYPGGPTIWW